ncbi:hypothetical protein K0A97_00380 [Patescibacteria group bacterium]|nr:hypothetical protein [Patescibacteria group bacterium]
MRCSICGISGEVSRLFDALSPKEKGVVKVCENCAKKEDMPILRRPTTFQLKKSETKRVYDNLLSARNKEGSFKVQQRSPIGKNKEEITLREIVDRNYKQTSSQKKEPQLDLVDNFHWVIMRARRLKKITQENLAREISESEAAIKMVEQGILPEDEYRLISKLESFLGIKLLKSQDKRGEWEGGISITGDLNEIDSYKKQPARIIKFDPIVTKNLTISDLKRMKEESKNLSDEETSDDFEEFDKALEEDDF